ncbi:hypothetical protein ACSYT7_07495, partial [Escherichia coli]
MMEIVLRTLTKKKTLLLMGLFFGLFSLLSFIVNPFFDFLIETLNIGLSRTSLSIALLLASAFSLSLIYLQSGGGEEKYENHPLELLLKELESQRKLTTEQLKELREKVESYESKNTLTEEEKRLIIDGAVEQTSQDAIKTIFATEAENLRNSIKDSLGFERLTERSYDITRRLRREITDLRLRSNINLLIGMSITAGGLYLLWTTV